MRRAGAVEARRLVFSAPWRPAAAERRYFGRSQAAAAARAPAETTLGDRSHAVSPVRSVVERRKMGKMRLVLPFQGPGPSRTRAFFWRNRPDCPYAELGIDAILEAWERPAKRYRQCAQNRLIRGVACLFADCRNTSIKLTPKNLLRSLDEALKQS